MNSYYFDIDFLNSKESNYRFRSTKESQEFEYLILYMGDNLYSTKKYSDDYIESIEALTNKKLCTLGDIKFAKPYLFSHSNLQTRYFDSKKTAENINSSILKEKIFNGSHLKSSREYILKPAHSFSGLGILKTSSDTHIINKIEDFENWVIEPLRKRIYDFSSLVLSEHEFITYETIVSKEFHFKGARFKHLELSDSELKSYNKSVAKISKYLAQEGINYPFSIDSYIYLQNGERKICALCEINARKTMGFFAYQLLELFKTDFGGFYIFPQSKKINSSELLIKLDPGNTRFATYFLKSCSEENITKLEKELFN